MDLNCRNIGLDDSSKSEFLLNIGCGNRFHAKWQNLDFSPVSKFVKKANLLERLSYQYNTVSYIYCSHFLEHIPRNKALHFLSECARILKKDGILRLVVPDMENICKEYIRIIDNEPHSFKRDWIVHELLDQMVRTEAGGCRKFITTFQILMTKIINNMYMKESAKYLIILGL